MAAAKIMIRDPGSGIVESLPKIIIISSDFCRNLGYFGQYWLDIQLRPRYIHFTLEPVLVKKGDEFDSVTAFYRKERYVRFEPLFQKK